MPRDIDLIIERLKAELSEVQVTQLHVTHRGADDNGLWFVTIAGRPEKVQLESPHGGCPFLIESDFSDKQHYGATVDEVVSTVRSLYA